VKNVRSSLFICSACLCKFIVHYQFDITTTTTTTIILFSFPLLPLFFMVSSLLFVSRSIELFWVDLLPYLRFYTLFQSALILERVPQDDDTVITEGLGPPPFATSISVPGSV
jgi:hypothetical protein